MTRPFNPRDELVILLKHKGAKVFHIPTITIHPIPNPTYLQEKLIHLLQLRNVIYFFSSKNAVEFFWHILQSLHLVDTFTSLLSEAIVLAIGPKTSLELKKKGIPKIHLPPTFSSDGILRFLTENQFPSKIIILVRSNRGRPFLIEELKNQNWVVHNLPVYRINPETPEKLAQILELITQKLVSLIIFTSSFAFKTLYDFAKRRGQLEAFISRLKRLIIAAIGPITKRAINQAGLEVDITPNQSTIPSLVNAIKCF
ncbi:MAG: uroporphyrinogen-III synthase [Candidatus Helarchaeota archaeon]